MRSHDIQIVEGSAELLPQIEPLWYELRAHHAAMAPQWRQGLLAGTFDKRKAGLGAKSPGGMLVLLAKDTDQLVAYCVCTIDSAHEAEIDSIYVTEPYRGNRLGRRLMERAMQWLGEMNVDGIVVDVMSGNDAAMKLYEQFGFQPRTVRMRHVVTRSAESSTPPARG